MVNNMLKMRKQNTIILSKLSNIDFIIKID